VIYFSQSQLLFTKTNKHRTTIRNALYQISQLCGVWISWDWKIIKLVCCTFELFQFQLDQLLQIWDIWCSLLNRVQWKKLGVDADLQWHVQTIHIAIIVKRPCQSYSDKVRHVSMSMNNLREYHWFIQSCCLRIKLLEA